MTRVAQATAAPVTHTSSSGSGGETAIGDEYPRYLYTLVEANKLPAIDLSKSVRSAVFSRRAAAVSSALARRFAQEINLLFLGGVVLGLLVCLLPAPPARFLAVVTVICLPASFAVLSSLRYEIVRLLLTTYEFWFFTLTDVLSSTLLALYLSDARVAVIPTLFFGTLGTILVDANSGVRRGFVIASMFAALYIFVLLAYASMHMIDEAHHFMLFRTNARSLSVEDALVNGWGTVMVLTCRNVYRKRAALKKHGANSTVVQCISYRCRLKLVRVASTSVVATRAAPQLSLSAATHRRAPAAAIDEEEAPQRRSTAEEPGAAAMAPTAGDQAQAAETTPAEAPGSPGPTSQSTKRSSAPHTQRLQATGTRGGASPPAAATTLTPLHYAHGGRTFAANNTIARSAVTLLLAQDANKALLRASKILIHATGVGGVVLVFFSITTDSVLRHRHSPQETDSHSRFRSLLQLTQPASLVCTAMFCAACVAMYQRQLLRRLILSFDYAFLSFQLTSVHLCVCDLVRWDRGASLVVGASWLWMHWVLAVDALTPLVQHRLGFRTRTFALPIVALFIVYQVVIAVDIVFDPHSTLQDRVVFEYVLGADHRLQLRVVPFLLSRLVTLLGWSLRILWRLWMLQVREGELVVIQGSVTYTRAGKATLPRRPSLWTQSRRQLRMVSALSLSALQANFRSPVAPSTSPSASVVLKAVRSTSVTSVVPIAPAPNEPSGLTR